MRCGKSMFVCIMLLNIFCICVPVYAQPLFHDWSQRFGDAYSQIADRVAVDGAGNVVVTGNFTGTVDFGGGVLTSAGSSDIFIAKFDASGAHLWSERWGDANSQVGSGIAVDASGNIVVTGYFQGNVDFGGGTLSSAGNEDIFIAKFHASGAHLWSKRFGDATNQYGYNVAVDCAGNVVVTGYFRDTVNFGGSALTSSGGLDIFIAEFDASGAHLWSNRFGDWDDQYGNSVAMDSAGNVVLTGYFASTVDFGGGALTSAGGNDIFIAKFDASGAYLWSKRFGDAADQYSYSVAVDGAGNEVVTGYFAGTVDFGGGVLSSAGGSDIFIAKFDASGAHLWSNRFGDASSQASRSVVADGSGNVVVTGYFTGTVNFGGSTLTCPGAYDIFLAKFWRASPIIHAIRDIPGDQGGWVNLAWDGSGADTPAEHAITRYTVWRAIDPSLVSQMISEGAVLATSARDWNVETSSEPLMRIQQVGATTYYWYLISSHDAYYLPGYSAPVPTLFDSTAVSTEYHYFQVIAHTSNPYVFYASDPDSGYSVDNLAPAAPQCFMAVQSVLPVGLELSWKGNRESDLADYGLYRGLNLDFTPDPGNLVASHADTVYFDSGWTWDSGYYYKVAARDIHGNESGYAMLSPEDVTGGEVPAIRGTYLLQNYPNPFKPLTRIGFGLEQGGDVSLKIYDAAGRLVRVLVDDLLEARRYEEVWDGTDAGGKPVSSGVYFYRLVAGSDVLTRKAVLLK